MSFSFIKKSLLLLAATVGLAQAGKVSMTALPNPGTGTYMGRPETSIFPPGSPVTSNWQIPVRGFRTTSDGSFSYQSGELSTATSFRDGWVSKTDSFGKVQWVKSMRQIVDASPYASSITSYSDGYFRVNDVLFADGSLYACGDATTGGTSIYDAYVARISPAGDLQDFSYFKTSATYARAVSLCSTVVGGQLRIGVVGDFSGSTLRVSPRVGTGAADIFTGMKGPNVVGNTTALSVRDVFAVVLDKQLGYGHNGWTLGDFSMNEYATCSAFDGQGNLVLGMSCHYPHLSSGYSLHGILSNREMRFNNTQSTSIGGTGTFGANHTVYGGGFSLVLKLNKDTGAITDSASPYLHTSNTGFSGTLSWVGTNFNHVSDMAADGGQLYVAGAFRNIIYPSVNGYTFGPSTASTQFSQGDADIFVAKLDLNDFTWQKHILLSSAGNDEPTQIVVNSGSVYLSGFAGSGLTHRVPLPDSGQSANNVSTKTTLPGSGSPHLFWTKLKSSDLTNEWHITPYENSVLGLGLPSDNFRGAGISLAGQNLLFTAANGANVTPHTFGTSANYATLPMENRFSVFNVIAKPDGSFLEEVNLNIVSAYGSPLPGKGVVKVPQGNSTRISVEPIIYENAAGTILDANNAALLRSDAVTRRVCTGYTVRNSTINGTANALDFTASNDSEITFLWRTEHAVEIKSDLVPGLTSEAAGTPSPEVNKHWMAEDSPIVAQIDGAQQSLTENGVRYRSTGYTATGPAVPASGTSGMLVPWGAFQQRQQVPQFTLTGPVTLVWKWQKEMSFRVATAPASASGGATAVSGTTSYTGDGEHWFTPGSSVTVTSPPLRDAGRQILLGYTTGVGSVTPADETAVEGVLSKTFTLNSASSLLWNYGKNPVRQRVTIGNPAVWTGMIASVVNTKPIGITVVSDAPPGTTPANGVVYEPLGRVIWPVRPGKYLLEFNDPAVDAANANAEDNVTMEITAGFQGKTVPKSNPVATFGPPTDAASYQTYIAGSPAVALNSSATDTAFWKTNYQMNGAIAAEGLALVGGDAAVTGEGLFSAKEIGTSVLVFSKAAAGNVGRGNLESESLFVRVVECYTWNDAAVKTLGTATVGSAIAPPATHDEAAIGHSGYVLAAKAPYNATLHNNSTLAGPIFPVNKPATTADAEKMAVTWYNRDAAISANWPSRSIDYTVTYPTVTPRIVIASRLGSEGKAGTAAGGEIQTIFTPPQFTNLAIYNQPDRSLPGYNPNEEHALLAPSFLDASRQAVFALQNSLNVTAAGSGYTSDPRVLVQYTETTGTPPVSTPKMAVYAVEFEDAATTDTRLPAYNQTYTAKYEIVAGKILTPPWPLPIVYGASPWPKENVIENEDAAQRSAWQDRKKQWWAVSGDTDAATEVKGQFFYPRRADFDSALALNTSISILNDATKTFHFNTVWPANVAVLKNGETITHSGGEAFSDGQTPSGLPSVVGMASAEIVYDHANKTLSSADINTSWIARVVNPLEPVEVNLLVADMPADLQPASGNVIVDGLLWRFKKLNAGMQQRLYYDPQRGKLGFRGYLNGRLLGDRELTAAPPAINLLQPNIMTPAEATAATAVNSDAKWTAAVDALSKASRDPVDKATGFTVGLKKDGSNFAPAGLVGPGMAIIPNPDLADPARMTSITTEGYFTFAENNATSLGAAPIALHVVKLDKTKKYRGAIAPIYPENVFDEKITLRHNGDFGGNVGNLVFQWYYREEDGTNANPPGVAFPSPPGAPAVGRWTLFGEILGGNEISLAGASAALLADNLFFCRWRHINEAAAAYSDYAGAANSRPPVVGSPSIATDAAYVPQLAEGWVKRVTNAVNAFDARIRDFRNNSAPSTAVSMLQQAGGRWEGNVAFNPAKDVIENYGLIELYQTVLNRAADLSINLQPGTSGVNTALLNAANRIASLYTLLGNEAYSDSVDPTIGFGTTSGQYGNLAPSIFCFQNQAGNLLEEELGLLRGRGEIGARPAYNRLMWNFTNGQGEAAYVMNYGITDMTNDGFLDANDGARLFPQGHGDAWGHYTMALRGYAGLFRQANFAWDTRSEKYQINGVVFDIDYMDERAFAETAAARAKAGTEIVDLVYRQKYTDNPAGQWQGYQDTNVDRAWGVFESAQRVTAGAYFDWLTANALLPAKDETKEGITRVDRTTVGALKDIAANGGAAQTKLDMADNALNPLGLDADAVPFDIDPVRTDRTAVAPATHFEQVYERAVAASQNALRAFDYANQSGQMLRRTAGSAEQLRQQTIDQDRDYRNRLIEILGTPYSGQIGAGKAYPPGYTGPDLYLHMYVDQVAIIGDGDNATLPQTSQVKDMTVKLGGLIKLVTDTNPFEAGNQGGHDYSQGQIRNWFPNDYPTAVLEVGQSDYWKFTIPLRTSGYAFKADPAWGMRAAPGKAQAALADMLMAEYDLLMATEGYEGYVDDFRIKMKAFTAKSGLAAEDILMVGNARTALNWLASVQTAADLTATGVAHVRENTKDMFDAVVQTIPSAFGNFGEPFKGAVKAIEAGTMTVQRVIQFVSEVVSAGTGLSAGIVERQLMVNQTINGHQVEVIDMLEDLEYHVQTEPDHRLAIFQATERLRSAGDRYRTILQEGLRLVEEREAFNKRVAATTTQQRYEDYTFRIARNEALGKYRSLFDVATRHAWLAGRAYAYELNLPDNHAANSAPIIAETLRTRTLGRFDGGQPTTGSGGIAEQLAIMKANFDVMKGQLGFNAPATQTINFSLRAELARVGLSSRVNADWRTQLETYRVADIWNYSHTKDGVDYGQIFRRHCRPFAPEAAGPQAALVIPFSSAIVAGQNWFGKTLMGGDSTFTASNFSTKIRSSGVKFESYNTSAMAVTPQVYLVPIGQDRMYYPNSNLLESRSWRVLDQSIPAPLAVTTGQLADANWLPFTGSSSGYFEESRRHSAFRAYHDAGGYSNAEMLATSRLVGRSAWNTQWVLIIPSNAILADPPNGAYPGDADAGLDTFIYGAPLPGFTHATAGTANRDGSGVRDIRLLFQTYSASGN